MIDAEGYTYYGGISATDHYGNYFDFRFYDLQKAKVKKVVKSKEKRSK
jgi:hypothetical protein